MNDATDDPDSPPEPEQTFYRMAYSVLPEYAAKDADALAARLSAGTAGAAFFYLLTCKWLGREPDAATAHRFEVRAGSLDDRHEYVAVRYPAPRPIDLSGRSEAQMFAAMRGTVLAPHFSVLVRASDGAPAQYFVLGQAPLGGGTTLRRVSTTFNANLGPGPTPDWEPLLDRLRAGLAEGMEPIAGVGRPGPGEWPAGGGAARKPKRWWQFWRR